AAVAAAARTAALLEAVRAIHGLVVAGLERHLSLLAAAGTRRAEHLALSASAGAIPAAIRGRAVAAICGSAVALRLAGSAAIRAATRFGKPAAGVEVLLAAGECKCLTAIAAGQNGVGRHRDGSLRG